MAVDTLQIGQTALNNFQQNLSTTGHNVANVNTPDYSRQRVESATRDPQRIQAGFLGTGVNTTTVRRSYDEALNTQMRTATASSSYWDSYQNMAASVDNVLADPKVALTPALDQFFASLQQLSTDPLSVPQRTVVLQQAQVVTDRFHMLAGYLEEQEQGTYRSVEAATKEVNQLAQNIADINQEIIILANRGEPPPNDLLDRRDALLRQLADDLNIATVYDEKGRVNVYTAKGEPMVLGDQAGRLEVSQNNDGVTVSLRWNGEPAKDITNFVAGGTIGGALGFLNDVLYPAQAQLDEMALTLAKEINAFQKDGVTMDNHGGKALFAVNSNHRSAASLELSLDDPEDIAASSRRGQPGNNENVLAMARLQDDKLFENKSATFTQYYSDLVADTGSKTQTAEINWTGQKQILDEVTQKRNSLAGVNLDEEAANLLRYEQAYMAATQIIAATDRTFQELLSVVRS
jgi:flagellar hook-associated protein 1 FlgK